MATEGSEKALEVIGLGRAFGEVEALSDINITVTAGEWVAIMGSSGAGKTTLLNILSLLDPPSSGSYLIDGIDTAGLNDSERTVVRREKIGLVFQQFHLVPYLTALENVMLAQYLHSMQDEKMAKQILDEVGLGHRHDHRPSQLSGGEQQRVCIARALVNDPTIILADEPTGNLDEENERIVLGLFKELHRKGRTIVMVTHNPDLGKEAGRIIRLHFGRIVE